MSKQIEALKLALEALEIGHEYAVETAEHFHIEMAGYKQHRHDAMDAEVKQISDAITAIREALAEQRPQNCGTGYCSCIECPYEQPAQQQEVNVPVADNTYGYAKSLAEAIFKQHFASDEHYASGRIVWEVNDTVIGILTQIDNMVADMVRRPAQQQEQIVAWITNGSLYGLRRTNKKTVVVHREKTKVARIPVFIKVDA